MITYLSGGHKLSVPDQKIISIDGKFSLCASTKILRVALNAIHSIFKQKFTIIVFSKGSPIFLDFLPPLLDNRALSSRGGRKS